MASTSNTQLPALPKEQPSIPTPTTNTHTSFVTLPPGTLPTTPYHTTRPFNLNVFPLSPTSNFPPQNDFQYPPTQPATVPFYNGFTPTNLPQPTSNFTTLTPPLNIKLLDSNYLLWEKKLLNHVIMFGLEGFINGIVQKPPQFLDAAHTQVSPTYINWQKCNRTLMSWIDSSLNEDKLGEIVGYDTAYEIWESLRTVYESSSTAKMMGFPS